MESKEFKALKEQLLSCRRNGFDRMDAAERERHGIVLHGLQGISGH